MGLNGLTILLEGPNCHFTKFKWWVAQVRNIS